jgi:hypothetical protein
MTGELYFPDLFEGRLKGGETTSRVDRRLGNGGGGQLDPKTIFIEILLMPVQLKKSLVYSSAPSL